MKIGNQTNIQVQKLYEAQRESEITRKSMAKGVPATIPSERGCPPEDPHSTAVWPSPWFFSPPLIFCNFPNPCHSRPHFFTVVASASFPDCRLVPAGGLAGGGLSRFPTKFNSRSPFVGGCGFFAGGFPSSPPHGVGPHAELVGGWVREGRANWFELG